MASRKVPGKGNDAKTDWVGIAAVQTVWGRRGEVSAELLTDFPERFQPGLQVAVRNGEYSRQLCIESAWRHKGRMILKFEGVNSISEAELLRGALLEVPRSERFPLPEDRVYVSDLIGCSVEEQGAILGSVEGWEETGGVPLLRVDSSGRELLIPFTPAICYSVDIEEKRIRVKLPEGLLDLNAAPRSKQKARRRKLAL